MKAWLAGARWRYSLLHIPEGAILWLACVWLGYGAAALGVVVWYWSRKKAEVEAVRWSEGQSHFDTTWVGWFPWQWSRYQVLDVALPGLFWSAVSLGIWVTT